MTPQHLDDDALSATLDGEATPDERAHVEACAACQARVEELRRAASAIGTPVAVVDPGRRDAAIAAALVALPTPLASRRRRQPPGWLVGAAAAVLALGILVPLVNRSSSSEDRDASSAAPAGRSLSKAAPEAQDSAATGSAPMMALAPNDLGAITGEDELRQRVLDALQAPPTTDAAPTSTTVAANGGGTAADPCLDRLRADDGTLGAPRLDARATVDGTPARVLAFEVADDPGTLDVLAVTDGCDVLRSTTVQAP